MDFALITESGGADMTFTQSGNIFNNIYLSLSITKGTWFFNPNFGMRSTARLKNTDNTARLIVQWVKEALQWLLDTGRAASIEVTAERDRLQDPHRLKLLVEAVQADGRRITFEKFVEVV